ncbi:nitrilase-related carbon-nitrogen hydrolase [Jatrophihabitans lederbergiae]|uniref:Nitrilase-related carbon-nitrogen hydrolase n=1 Tax=Jatrophihabitans lederbergiae TaxID=3075547 RepID=A0ABU2JEX3_9ACTN|nr:nitrilase-related carbon-nitrogen hydrolase [Jatrophihabitans sp. DSM 44399]MDT0263535.1 nitrilase-related carbon-nitrogen hydrolase [Jatrophihabitans sp. DSM 44399]
MTDATGIVRVVCAQLSPVLGELAGNQDRVLAAVCSARADRADVVVLPELATSGYVFQSSEEAASVALAADDAFFGRVAELLAGTNSIVVVGFCERGPGSTLWNGAALIDRSGVVTVYRKTHLWDRETLVFTPGQDPAPIVETVHGRIGILICYDLEFAEMPRALAIAGADLIAVPTNWPSGEHPSDERAAEVIYAQAAARSNGVFIACCDRAGVERGQAWTEGSVIVDQFGWVCAAATSGGRAGPGESGVGESRVGESGVGESSARDPALPVPTARADVFPRLARDKSISPHNDLLGDRRPELYARGQK